MSKLNLSHADSIAVSQYLQKAIGARGVNEISRELGPLVSDVPLLVNKLICFESLYPGIVGSVVVFIIGLLTNKNPITEKLNDLEFVESERNRFREAVLGKEESVDDTYELYEKLTAFFIKMAKSVPSDTDGL